MSADARNTGSPSCRQMWTVRALSSHATAASTTARRIALAREDPMVDHQHSRTAVLGQGGDDALAGVIAAEKWERADGDLPAELVRRAVSTQGIDSPRAAHAVA
jgi:hypothetical protein